MSDQDLAALCDELERHDLEMTAAPWREWAEPTGAGCEWKDSLPPGSTCIESTGTVFALGVAVCATPGENSRDVDGIAYLRNNAARVASELRRLREETDRQRARADAAEALVVRLSRLLALATPWPVQDVLAKLADAADHLLNYHDCDRHGYEGVVAARDAARTIVAALLGDP